MKKEQAEEIKEHLSKEGFYTTIIKNEYGYQVLIEGIKLGYAFR